MTISLQTNWYLILFCVTGVVFSFAFSFRQFRSSPVRKGRMMIMELLRTLIIIIIAFTLLRPEIVTKITQKSDPEIVILHDVSGSMNTQDLVVMKSGIPRTVKRREWVAEQLDRKFYSPLEKEYNIAVESFSMPPDISDNEEKDATDLAYALSAQISKYKNLRGVILMSDADWNFGGSPVGVASRLRKRSVPIYVVATGSPAYLPDLELKKVKAPAFCLAGEKISIPFQIRNRMNRDITTRIILSSEYGRENEKEIVIPARELFQESIIWQPRKAGTYQLTLDLPVQKGELIPENNRFSFTIVVKRELLKVLLVDSEPRWEYRYLRNALMRDPGVEVKTLLLHPGMSLGGGKNYIDKFPDKEEISKFDVIFLGDVGLGQGELTQDDLKLIEGVVKHQGTGLVLLPGYRGRHLSFSKTVIDDMYPVELDKSRPAGISSAVPSSIDLSSEGRKHFLLMLADSPTENSYVWKKLPGFYWNAAVLKTRPGAHVLALHSGLRSDSGRMPLIVIRGYGNGSVLFMGIDSAWRWRKGVEDKYHYRYWGQVVRWMAHKRHIADNKGLRCFFLPEIPQVGNTVYLFATLNDRLGRPVDKAVVNFSAQPEVGGSVRAFNLKQEKEGWGVYKGSFVPEVGGLYKARISSPETGSDLDFLINVSAVKREQTGHPVRIRTMYELANITGGGVFMPEELDRVISQIDALPRQIELEKRFMLWCQWWWGAMIIFMLALYWSLRKIFGLL